MVFTTLVAGAFFVFYLWYDRRRSAYLHGFALLAALAILTKGPVALVMLLPAAVLFLLFQRDRAGLRAFLVHPWWLVLFAVAAPWYLYATLVHGRAFTWEFLVHDNWHRILRAEHPSLDHWYFYPGVIVVGMLPWTGLFAFLGAGFREHRALHVYLLTWIGSVYVVFALAHSKLPSYILPLFPALALLVAVSVAAGAASARRRAAAAAVSVLGGAGLLAGALLAWPFVATGIRGRDVPPCRSRRRRLRRRPLRHRRPASRATGRGSRRSEHRRPAVHGAARNPERSACDGPGFHGRRRPGSSSPATASRARPSWRARSPPAACTTARATRWS